MMTLSPSLTQTKCDPYLPPCWEVGDGVGVLHVLVMLMQLLVLHFVDMPSSVVKDC